ncbi:MAG: hypothetical protein LBH00_03990 [Planctomycetaceae bacterium]|jgi:hypothetical protein|nr:hypothetical protein [Planctomycetaceae bacterium]
MPKTLCLLSLIISVFIALLFLLDLIVKIPFGGVGGLLGHIGMIAGAAVIGTFSYLTGKECH